MSVMTLLRFLFGNRRAIREIASNRSVLGLGLLFVLSAGLAREYDQEDLLHEPGYLLIPLAASLVSSFILFCLVYFVRTRYERKFVTDYISFLGLYWMTAPLAWLYAIPFERWMDPLEATQANLCLLGLVATWRVLLISRVVSVIFRFRYIAALFVVMLFADAVVLWILCFTPAPIVSIMGGIGQFSPVEELIRETRLTVSLSGFFSLPIWFIGTLVVFVGKRIRHSVWPPLRIASSAQQKLSPRLWIIGVSSLLVWVFVLPFVQPQQQNRRWVEQTIKLGKIVDAIAYMSSRQRDDFPPHWDPPPKIRYGRFNPPLWKILLRLEEKKSSEWVKVLYQEKLITLAQNNLYSRKGPFRLKEMKDDELEGYIQWIANSKEPNLLAGQHEKEIRYTLYDFKSGKKVEKDHQLIGQSRLQSLKKLAELGKFKKRELSR